MKRHPLEPLSLISGVVFLAFALVYLVGARLDVMVSPAISLPLLVVGLGGAGIVAAIVGQQQVDSVESPGGGAYLPPREGPAESAEDDPVESAEGDRDLDGDVDPR